MKKIILSMFVAVMAFATTQAQDHQKMGHRGHRGFGHGIDMQKLNLTDSQKEQMKAIRADFGKQLAELKKNDNISVKEYRSKMEALRNENKNKIQGVFTPEQKAQIEKMKEEAKAKHAEQAKARAEKFKKDLNLSDEQSAKLSQLRDNTSAKMKALHENKSLSSEEKKEQFKALVKAQHEEFKAVLTPEQLQKMEELKKSRHSNWSK